MHDDHSLQDIEKGASKEKNETPTESSAVRGNTTCVPENVEMDGTFYPFLVFPFCYCV